MVEKVVDSTDRLKEFPESGRIVPEIDDTSIREIQVPPYRIIYEIMTDKISVLAVIHGRTKLSNKDITS